MSSYLKYQVEPSTIHLQGRRLVYPLHKCHCLIMCTGLSHVNIAVPDGTLDLAIDFYGNTIGPGMSGSSSTAQVKSSDWFLDMLERFQNAAIMSPSRVSRVQCRLVAILTNCLRVGDVRQMICQPMASIQTALRHSAHKSVCGAAALLPHTSSACMSWRNNVE